VYYYPYIPHYRVNKKTGKIQRLENDLLRGIKGEATAIQFYRQLAQMAKTDEQRKDIEHAIEDEQTHLKEFTNLYISLFGKQPVYQVEKKVLSSFAEGLKLAREDELEAYEDYRNVYLSTKDSNVRDVFFRALTDEMEHALRFAILLLEQR
jgi:rubrerythrin